jgi:hypothetical protein
MPVLEVVEAIEGEVFAGNEMGFQGGLKRPQLLAGRQGRPGCCAQPPLAQSRKTGARRHGGWGQGAESELSQKATVSCRGRHKELSVVGCRTRWRSGELLHLCSEAVER